MVVDQTFEGSACGSVAEKIKLGKLSISKGGP
jgi:hypothetical protein